MIEICLGLKLSNDWSLAFGLPIGFEQATNVNGALDNEDNKNVKKKDNKCKFRFISVFYFFARTIQTLKNKK